MPKQRKNKLIAKVVDFFYSMPILLAIWVYQETSNQWLAGLSFIISLGILHLVINKYKQWKQQKLLRSDIDVVDDMTGIVFEEYVLAHFKHLGYAGRLTPTADGADMIVQKDTEKVVIQAKRWKNSVGIEAIEQVIRAKKYYNADKGIVVTNSTFTKSAQELADANEIALWDREKLIELIDNVLNNKNTYTQEKEQAI